MDVDPSGAFNWGFYPVSGYLNLNQDKPATVNSIALAARYYF